MAIKAIDAGSPNFIDGHFRQTIVIRGNDTGFPGCGPQNLAQGDLQRSRLRAYRSQKMSFVGSLNFFPNDEANPIHQLIRNSRIVDSGL